MKNIILLLISLVAVSAQALPLQQIQTYDQRYQLASRNQKLVDNYGNGYEDLYGVRNFRPVLRGILYRGGANNAYNKYGKRNNQNPLPNLGLENLCKQNFKSAIYLYTTNFATAAKSTQCQTLDDQANKLTYSQISGLEAKNTNKFLDIIFKAIKGQTPSPIYLHCWNGWHASGLVSTLALRQFCDLSPAEALKYWEQNTDGNSAGYSSIKARIQSFQPLPQYKISAAEQNEICFSN